MPAPVLLVTNDDGVDSHFLRVLVDALQSAGFATRVAAPVGEQSWIARALSRRRPVQVHDRADFRDPAWAIDGTPTDCVNIALGHLLSEPPAAVVSGINLGENASLPYILGSGTVAGALEGALWGLPALAFSFQLPQSRIDDVRHHHGKVDGPLGASLLAAAAHAAKFVQQRLAQTTPDTGPTVHNINFPSVTTAVTPIERTRPGGRKLGRLFVRDEAASSTFNFRYTDDHPRENHPEADHHALARGVISHSILNFATLGR